MNTFSTISLKQAPEPKQTATQISRGGPSLWWQPKKEQEACHYYQVPTAEGLGDAECLRLQSLFTLFIVMHATDWPAALAVAGETDKHKFLLRLRHLLPYSILSIYFLVFPTWTSGWIFTVGQWGHLPSWACLNAFLSTWQESFPVSLGHCHRCWWRQLWPWQGRPSHAFLAQRHKKQKCSQAQIPWLCS